MVAGAPAFPYALRATVTADLDRLIEALALLQAKACAVRNLCEDRRTPRERGQVRWASPSLQDLKLRSGSVLHPNVCPGRLQLLPASYAIFQKALPSG